MASLANHIPNRIFWMDRGPRSDQPAQRPPRSRSPSLAQARAATESGLYSPAKAATSCQGDSIGTSRSSVAMRA
jgi:hypothetical protein